AYPDRKYEALRVCSCQVYSITVVKKTGFSLKILEAYTRDVGRGIARIDYEALDSLKASAGDIIEIAGGKRLIIAKCMPLYPSDEGRQVIRIDGLARSNSGVAIGDAVTITKVKAVAAEKVTLAAVESVPQIDEQYLTDALDNIPIVKGDKVTVPYFGGRLTFEVIAVTPASVPTLSNKGTIFHITESEVVRSGIAHVTFE